MDVILGLLAILFIWVIFVDYSTEKFSEKKNDYSTIFVKKIDSEPWVTMKGDHIARTQADSRSNPKS